MTTIRVTAAIRRDDTILNMGGDGDNWLMTWCADGTQLTGLCDGSHLPGGAAGHLYNSRLYRVVGSPPDVTFEEVAGYPALPLDPRERPDDDAARYYGFGIVEVDGVVYQFMSTFGTAEVGGGEPLLAFVGVKLIYSPDRGLTWFNQDGTTPVTFPSRSRQSRDTMLFLHEPAESFALISVLQMGRGYDANTDGYVYLYTPNGVVETTMNALALARVPKEKVLDRDAYEYFVARDDTIGSARWSSDIAERRPVHTFATGWVNRYAHPYAWQPSVVYNAPLGVYLMASWGMGTGADGTWFAKPSYLGLWTAPRPWGPWTQILEEPAWTPHGDPGARCYQPQISPKWIADDGRSFWIVWTDFQSPGVDFDAAIAEVTRSATSVTDWVQQMMPLRPGYSFNLQRVDLVDH